MHKEVLNQEFSTLISLAAAAGTMWAGGFGMFAAEGASLSMGTVMQQSVFTGLASSGAVSMVNNKFDLGKVASDLASPDSLYNLGLNSLTAGLTFGASQGLGIEQIKPGLELIDRAEIVAKNGLVGIGVRSALSAGTGDKLGNIIKDETLSGGLALGQSVVGDIAQSKNFATGSIEKTTLHALTGATYSSLTNSKPLSGSIGGISSELVAGLMESSTGLNGPPSDVPLTNEQAKINADKRISLNNNVKATTKLVSATVTMLAGGNAKDITLSANVGESAVKHNRRLHPSEEQILAELQQGKSPDEQRRLELAAKYLVKASAGVSLNDEQYTPLSQDEIEGSTYVEEQQMLSSLATEKNKALEWTRTMEVAKLAEGLNGDPSKYTQRTFDYTALDGIEDWASSRIAEPVFRFEHGEEALMSGIGALTLKGASQIINTMPFGLGNETVNTLNSASDYLQEHSISHSFNMIEPYIPTEGNMVQASFNSSVNDSYISEHASSLASMAAIGLSTAIKGATKLGKAIPKAFKSTVTANKTTPTSSISITTQVENTITGDSSLLHSAQVRDVGGNVNKEVVKQQNVHVVSRNSPNPQYRVPGRVQSRIDLHNPGWEHTMHRHYNPTKNASQYTIPKTELREILQSKEVVHSPVVKILNTEKKLEKWSYVREIDVGKIIGVDKFTGQPTSKITILTDFKGKLRSASPGRLD